MGNELKESLRAHLTMVVLLLWVGSNLWFTANFFQPLLDNAFDLKLVDWLRGIGVPEILVGLNVFTSCAGFFIFMLCSPPFFLWCFLERTRRRKDTATRSGN